jgi:putative chitinase
MIARDIFFDRIRPSVFHGRLKQKQVEGTAAILDAWDGLPLDDLRWLAACLGTAYHETAFTMQPIAEYGRGRGHPYGRPGKNGGQIPYGRGLVQLTWDENYERFDALLGLKGALIRDYNLALRPDIAAKILLVGEAEGVFARFKLSDYLNANATDWLHCRRIVNGMDHAEDIAGYSRNFYIGLEAASATAAAA